MSFGHQNSLAVTVASHGRDNGSQMVIVPWQITKSNSFPEEPAHGPSMPPATTYNPSEGIFEKASGLSRATFVVCENFIRKMFAEPSTDVALFVDRGTPASRHQHVFFPSFGSPDDHLALIFLVQLCTNDNVTATIIRVMKPVNSPRANTETITSTETTENSKVGVSMAFASYLTVH
ncbi:hypothetical protein BU17DRAFT_86081 [Hysterangium stoloniferum]|nr:hypothetical protein BU17DRAFT_86081 [Hysterangium stoloniferum]